MNPLHFISAGAGSGKTYALTETLSRLLRDGAIRPAGVIATTFTKKAATELRERVRMRLLEEGLFSQANAMGQARIGTVHGICGELLQRFAFEAGLAPQQQVIDEIQSQVLILEAIDASRNATQIGDLLQLVGRLGIPDWASELKSLINAARSNDIGPDALRGFGKHNADDLLAYFPKPLEKDLDGEALAAIKRALPELHPAAEKSGKKNSLAYVDQLQQFQRQLMAGNLPWSEWISLSKAMPEKNLQQPHAEALQAIAQQVSAHSKLHSDIRNYLDVIFNLAADTLGHYQQRKMDLGVVDFTDQEHLVLQLLDDPNVANSLREELDLLLVDEFQDTSPIQLALFMKLATMARQTYWVGDIKQAIYGFRGSDTALMQSILSALPSLGGSKSILKHSYRSCPDLVYLINRVFAHAFSDTLTAEEVALVPKRPALLSQPAFANWYLGGSRIDTRMQSLAMGVGHLLNLQRQVVDKHTKQPRPVRLSDIAILSRSNDGVANIANQLSRAGIPVATARPGLLATPEATLAFACLRRLNDPTDTIASAEILSLADCEEPESWLSDRLRYLAAGNERQKWRETGNDAHPLLARIAALRTQLSLLAPSEALQLVITACNLPFLILQWQHDETLARRRLANLEAMQALALEYEDICQNTHQTATITGLILWLQQMAADELDELAQPSIDAVRVMTHHAAKGLEWPIVILSDLDKAVRDRLWGISSLSNQDFDANEPLKARFIRYWPWPFGKQSAGIPVSDHIDRTPIAQKFQIDAIDEARRLLYVSMTRARDMLILALNDKASSHEWLETLDAPWLLPQKGSNSPIPVSKDMHIACEQWQLDAVLEATSTPPTEQSLYGFPAQAPTIRLPLSFNPSRASANAVEIVETVEIGQRIPVAADTDWASLGCALHACIATNCSDANAPLNENEIEQILQGFGVANALSADKVLKQIQAFSHWLTNRWPNGRLLAEVPVLATMPNQQRLNGRIDLLVETAEGYVLFDHKSSPLGPSQWSSLAAAYSGQLDAYATAVKRAMGKSVSECWLFLPVAGGAVRVNIG